MGFDTGIHAGFFLLIFMTGIFTSVTDLRHKKIRNYHLIIIVVASVILTGIEVFLNRSVPVLQISSAGCAVIIAWVFYKHDLWRGGDAKLFVIYSFLMPATGYESKIFLPCIALFADTFIMALIFVSLLMLRDFCVNPKYVLANIRENFTFNEIREGFLVTSGISWVLFPLIHACGLTKYSCWSFLIVYLVSVSIVQVISKLFRNMVFVFILFGVGLFLRYRFSPDFFQWNNIVHYLYVVIVYSFFSYLLFKGVKCVENSKERIPFAPFLFLGCLLSYTHFLGLMMSFQHIGK